MARLCRMNVPNITNTHAVQKPYGYLFLFALRESPDFLFQLLPVGQIQLISAYKKLIRNILGSISDHQFILIGSHNNSNGFCISFRVHFFSVIVQVQIHLADIFMLDFTPF